MLSKKVKKLGTNYTFFRPSALVHWYASMGNQCLNKLILFMILVKCWSYVDFPMYQVRIEYLKSIE